MKERYEVHHGVRIQDAALVAAATLAHRYIADRFLPDKAIDLVDEAASRIKMELDSKPTALDQLDRQLLQLEIERTSLAKEKDAASQERLRKLEAEIANLKEKSQALTAQWQNEKAAVNAASVVQSQLEQARLELEQAQRRGDLTQSAEIQYGRIPELEKKLAGIQQQAATPTARTSLLRQEVTDADIAKFAADAHPSQLHARKRTRQPAVGRSCGNGLSDNEDHRAAPRAPVPEDHPNAHRLVHAGPTGVGNRDGACSPSFVRYQHALGIDMSSIWIVSVTSHCAHYVT